MRRSLFALALLQFASALLHSHAERKQEKWWLDNLDARANERNWDNWRSGQEKYAYVTMKYVYGKTIGSTWEASLKDSLSDEQIEEEANKLFDPERAAYFTKQARAFNKKAELETELDGEKPCEDRDPLRQITRLANQLSSSDAKYPLLVYTNDECLVNMSSALPSNVILETNFKYLPKHCAMNAKNFMHFQKMGVFGLTQYKKLMWMDWDLEITKNIDDLFDKDTNNGKTIYGQRDDWKCTGRENVAKLIDSASGGFCSGLMLFEPSTEAVKELVANQGKVCWGDQQVISRTFARQIEGKSTGREWKVWDNDVIAFRPCRSQFKPRVVHNADLPNSDPGKEWK